MNPFKILISKFILLVLQFFFFNLVNSYPAFCGQQTGSVYGFVDTLFPEVSPFNSAIVSTWNGFTLPGQSDYGVAIMTAIKTIYDVLKIQAKHQCVILISCGQGKPPVFEHWALLAVQSHLNKMGCCLCTMCISLGPFTSKFRDTCRKLSVIQPHAQFQLNLNLSDFWSK